MCAYKILCCLNNISGYLEELATQRDSFVNPFVMTPICLVYKTAQMNSLGRLMNSVPSSLSSTSTFQSLDSKSKLIVPCSFYIAVRSLDMYASIRIEFPEQKCVGSGGGVKGRWISYLHIHNDLLGEVTQI